MNITLKLNNAKETVKTVKINTAGNEAVRVQAENDVNYQLVDDNTGYGPENITTKRVGNDLQIAFEGSNIEHPDLIIEGYYEQDDSNLIVGLYENGNLYPYVPETGLQSDAVTLLAEEVSAGQALGGEALNSAMWAFNPWWLLALVPLAGIAIAAGHHSSGGHNSHTEADMIPPAAPTVNANIDGSVKIIPPSDADTKTVTIRYTDEDGVEHTSTVEKGQDGKWTSTDPNLIVDGNTGKITIPSDKVKDNTKVTADATDQSGNKGPEGEAIAGIDQVEGTPSISIPEAQDGYINNSELEDGVQTEITLPKGTVEGAIVTVTITKPDSSVEEIRHVVTGDEAASGKINLVIPKESLPNDGDYNVNVSIQQGNNPVISGNTESFKLDTGVPGDVDKDGDADNGDNDAHTQNGAPIVTITDGNGDDYINSEELKDGVQTNVTVPTGTEAGDTITVTVTDPNGNKVEVPHTVTEDDIKNGSADITIPKDAIPTDGDYTITAKVTDPAGNSSATSEPKTITVDTGVPGDVDKDGDADNGDNDAHTQNGAPIVTITDGNGDDYINSEELKDGVQTNVTVPTGTEAGDTITVTVTDPNGNKVEVPHTVTEDDIKNGSADITIPKEAIPTDGDYTITAKVTDPAGNSSAVSTPVPFTVDTTAPTAPTVTPNEDGSVTITPPTDKDTKTVEITYTDEETGEDRPVTVTKGEDGWTSNDPNVVVDKDTGVVTIPKDKVQDGSTVTAKVTDNAGNTGDEDSKQVNPNSDDLSGTPVLTIAEAEDGKVTATELNDGIQTEVKLQNNSKEGDVVTLTITKPDGTTQEVVHTLTSDEATSGKVSIDIPKSDVTSDGDYSVAVSQSRDGKTTAGNTENFTVDAHVPGDTDGDGETDEAGKPVVHIEDKDDGELNPDDLAEGKASAKITFPSDANYTAGDVLKVTLPDGSTQEITLTDDNIQNGVTVTFTPLAAGETNTVKAVVTDPQGNSTQEGSDSSITAEVGPKTITVAVADDFTDEYNGATLRTEGKEAGTLLAENGGLAKYEGAVGANGTTIDASSEANLLAIKSLATGLTNDATPTVTFTLDNKITSSQTMVIYRETVSKDGTTFNKQVLTGKFTVSEDGKTYTFTDSLPETYGTQYRYTAEVQNSSTKAVELTTRQDIYLDTQVESMEVTATSSSTTGSLNSITLSVLDRSEVDATIKVSYPNGAGGTSTTTAIANSDGTYTVNFTDTFNRYSAEGMTVTVIDAAGNISATKTMYLRNLFSNMNTEQGPDTSKPSRLNVGLITDIINRQTTSEDGLKFTNGDDHLVVGLDEYNGKAGVNGNMASMVGGGHLTMGDGNDKVTFNTAEVATGGQYNIDFGNGNDRLVINGAVNVGATMNVQFGEGNDTMYVKSNLDGSSSAVYDFGNGDNSLEVGGYVTKAQTFTFGDGVDSMVVNGHLDYATVNMGAGNDMFKVGGRLSYGATINMGEGDDVLVAGSLTNLDAQITTVDMGAGNDIATITSISPLSKVSMGEGDDILNVTNITGGTINLDSGDDVINVLGRISGSAETDGGEGKDTAALKEVGHSYDISYFKNVEIFDLTADGRQDIDITLSALQKDGVEKVYIRGTSVDTVDLGANNNYDNTTANLKDTSKGIAGGNVGNWAHATTETVDGVTYDVYSYTSGNSGTVTTELVYVEQGVQVI